MKDEDDDDERRRDKLILDDDHLSSLIVMMKIPRRNVPNSMRGNLTSHYHQSDANTYCPRVEVLVYNQNNSSIHYDDCYQKQKNKKKKKTKKFVEGRRSDYIHIYTLFDVQLEK